MGGQRETVGKEFRGGEGEEGSGVGIEERKGARRIGRVRINELKKGVRRRENVGRRRIGRIEKSAVKDADGCFSLGVVQMG